MDEIRKCPYCAEEIRTEATRCPHCRSRIAAFDPARWYRDRPERRLAGVAAAVAHAFALPVTAVRVGFIVLTFVHFLGPMVYGALWLIVPFAPGGVPPIERAVTAVREWFDGLRGRRPDGPPRSAQPNGQDRAHFDLVSGGPLS
jgi:phage shock protein PspC (stress-responsive transcriptional regulator)